jgi:DNA-binding MarR family transcriptional regulator
MDLDDSLRFGFLIHDVSRLRRVLVDRELKPLGITRSQWWVIAFLSRRDGMTQSALAADLDMTKVAIGGLLARLERAGYVERRTDTQDARARRVYLTKAGNRLMSTIRRNVDSVEVAVQSGLDEGDLVRTTQLLRDMKHRLVRLLTEEDPGAGEERRRYERSG